VLGVLLEEQRSVALDGITRVVCKYNHQTTVTEASDDVLSEIRISLYHVHLPKLAAAGFIDYDPERQLVEPTGQLDQVRLILSRIIDADPSLETPIELQ